MVKTGKVLKVLRKVIRLGDSLAVTLPKDFLKSASWVWIEKHENEILIREAHVE